MELRKQRQKSLRQTPPVGTTLGSGTHGRVTNSSQFSQDILSFSTVSPTSWETLGPSKWRWLMS